MAGLAAGEPGRLRPECGRGLSAPTKNEVAWQSSRGTEAPPTFNAPDTRGQECPRYRRLLAWLAFAVASVEVLGSRQKGKRLMEADVEGTILVRMKASPNILRRLI